MPETIVAVGASHAAAQVVDSLRREGFGGRLLLIGDEPELPYQRPPLSKKFLAGEVSEDRLPIRPAAYYDSIRCELLVGRRVVSLDTTARELLLDDDARVGYDQLVLSVGGQARRLRVPGADLPGIHTLRTLADVNAIRSALRPGLRAVIVGAGYIGLECAATLSKLGVDVTVIEMLDRVMSRVVAPEMSAFYAAEHATHGVRILPRLQVAGFGGKGCVASVECADGTSVPAEIVIVGIGLEPDTALAEAAGIKCDDGIAVDAHCRSSDPHVFAIGDCCSHPSPRYGRRIRLESVDNAFEQAKTAAANLCGRAHVHDRIPWFWSDQYDLKLQIVGLAQGHDQVLLRGDPAGRSFSCCYLKDGELLAVDAVNCTRDFMAARKLIAERVRPDLGLLADATRPMKDSA